MMAKGPSIRINEFREVLAKSKNILVITGAGISAESGVPTFRGANGLWSNKAIQRLAHAKTFEIDPASVWEFYHYRRELVRLKLPNEAHKALVRCEELFRQNNRTFSLVTTNTDGLHQRAGSKNVIEVHGSIFKTKCTNCSLVDENFDSPICAGLHGKEITFISNFQKSILELHDLPHCKTCGGLLRPAVTWFGEELDTDVNNQAWNLTNECDLGVIIGSSSNVYPAALFGTEIADKNVPVAEFNIEQTPFTSRFSYFLEGPAASTVPEAFTNIEFENTR